jgi:hypothetical protein
LRRSAGRRGWRRRQIAGLAAWSLLIWLAPAAGEERSPPGSQWPAGRGEGADPGAARAPGTSPGALPAYRLSIEAEPLRKLLAFRARIYDLSFLPPGERFWIPVTFVHEGEQYPAQLRIRGNLPAHWREDKISYRVKFGRRLFEGKKEIHLIVPWDKHYGIELLQTRIAGDLGLSSFPGRFANLEINEQDVGLYYESEHPTRQYLERTGKIASSIFTFSFHWTLYFGKDYHHIMFARPGSRAMSPLDSIGQIKQRPTFDRADPLLAKRQMAYVSELFTLLSEGRPEEIADRAGFYLDFENFAKYVALQNFFGTRHGMALNDNTRLYLEPSSGKFEFIPWDMRLMRLRERLQGPDAPLETLLEPQDEIFRELFRVIPGLRKLRHQVLRKLVDRGAEYRADLERIHAELIELYPRDERLKRRSGDLERIFRENQETLALYLARIEPPSDAERRSQ